MATTLKLISKEELIVKFKEIEARGWIKCPKRKKNDGSVAIFLKTYLAYQKTTFQFPMQQSGN